MSEAAQGTLTDYYGKLFQDGYLVSLHISRWGMEAKLDKKDIGVDKVNSLVRLGTKLLIAPEEISKFVSLEGKARRFLYKNAFTFPIAEAHFIPKKKIPALLSQLNTYKLEYQKLTDSLLERYEGLKASVIEKWDEEHREALLRCYPTTAKLRSKFSFDISIFELAVPKDFNEVDLLETINKERMNEDARKQALDEAKRAIASQKEHAMQQLKEFTTEAAKAVRSQLVEMCESICDQVRRGEVLTARSTRRIIDEIDNFRALNFFDDAAVSAEIERLSAVVTGGHNFRTDKEAITLLTNQLEEVKKRAVTDEDLDGVSENYFRVINI